ncbi:MAG: hypothetical protein ACR2HN_04150 [Tepidiformaceae bacterium]
MTEPADAAVVDTNVLLRYLTGDNAAQSPAAVAFFETAARAGRTLGLPLRILDRDVIDRALTLYPAVTLTRTIASSRHTQSCAAMDGWHRSIGGWAGSRVSSGWRRA